MIIYKHRLFRESSDLEVKRLERHLNRKVVKWKVYYTRVRNKRKATFIIFWKKCSDFELYSFFEELNSVKLEKKIFQTGKKRFVWKNTILHLVNYLSHFFQKKLKKYSLHTIWLICSSVILNFSKVLRPRKVNLEDITISWPSVSNLQNFFSTHFFGLSSPEKFKNSCYYVRTSLWSHSCTISWKLRKNTKKVAAVMSIRTIVRM